MTPDSSELGLSVATVIALVLFSLTNLIEKFLGALFYNVSVHLLEIGRTLKYIP